MFINAANPYGTDTFTVPASETNRPSRLAPKRNWKKPVPPSTLLMNFLLTF